MIRTPGIMLLGMLLLVAACSEPDADPAIVIDSTTVTPPAASPTAVSITELSPTPVDTTSLTVESDVSPALVTADLRTRFPSAAALLDASSVRAGVAVRTPDAEWYVGGDEETFALASVVKLPIMVATLERARLDDRAVTTGERSLLRQMIVVSDNNATDALWRSLGQGAGVAAILEPLGVTGIEYAPDHQWGDSQATALQIGRLLELLYREDSPLAEETREEALRLLESVVVGQNWGASAGVDLSVGLNTVLAIKNGWYPEPEGWLLNSAGVITVGADLDQSDVHVVVILTQGALTQTAGVGEIERIAAAINYVLVPPALAVVPAVRTFPPSPLPSVNLEVGDEVTELGPETTPEEQPEPAQVKLWVLPESGGVLTPAPGLLIGAESNSTELTLWYELSATAAEQMFLTYADSMRELGWTEVAGPPAIVLSKTDGGRWVGVSMQATSSDARLVQMTISPAPGILPAGVSAP